MCYVHILCFTQSKKHHHSLRGLSGSYNMLKPTSGFLQHSLSEAVLAQSTVSQSFDHSCHRVYGKNGWRVTREPLLTLLSEEAYQLDVKVCWMQIKLMLPELCMKLWVLGFLTTFKGDAIMKELLDRCNVLHKSSLCISVKQNLHIYLLIQFI